MKGFSELEKKELIKDVKKAKSEGQSLLFVFDEFSKKTNKAKGSVRNFYYKTIANCKNSEKLRLKLGVDKTMFPQLVLEFTKMEEERLLKQVLTLITSGKSVRGAISEIAGGNEKLALRYLNKYRNLIKEKKDLVYKIMDEVKSEIGRCKNPYETTYSIKKQRQIENGIDKIFKDAFLEQKQENARLVKRVEKLTKENAKIKEMLTKTLKNKDITKEFLNSISQKNA